MHDPALFDLLSCSPGGWAPGRPSPVVIAHRGASGSLPEHTLEAYTRAAEQGADYLEPDLVVTADGALVARHENELSSTTDIADRPEFAHLRTTKEIGGQAVSGWFCEDLTLDQVSTLRARERLPHLRPDNTDHDGRFLVPTFSDILRLREELVHRLRRPIGVYPELKTPQYFTSVGLPQAEPFVAAIRAAGLDQPDAPLGIQSFELTALQNMRRRMGVVAPMVLLFDLHGGPWDRRSVGDRRTYAQLLAPAVLDRLGADIDAIGVHKHHVIPERPDGSLGEPSGLVAAAHAAGLAVHAWTFRAENAFLPASLWRGSELSSHGDLPAEAQAYAAAGIDGMFTDHVDVVTGALGIEAGDLHLV